MEKTQQETKEGAREDKKEKEQQRPGPKMNVGCGCGCGCTPPFKQKR